ncbi:MAG: L,D-transpeptidase family protein [Desulfovibrio sp.]|nr:L,D-transpeptidase family protein [Desulfovibrio sp.]
MNWRAETGIPRTARFRAGRSLSFFAPLLLCLFFLAAAEPALADNWLASVRDAALPSHFVAVDKARQSFLFFEKKSPLKLRYAYPCTTGQQAGDKRKLNDLRTPEGVYFVEYKIASGLDFREYGGIAYTLNYPNPVDRLRGKTGHGIWIHSKGLGIVPRDTRGCVAIGLEDINEVGPSLTPGTAVILAERLDEKRIPDQDDGSARQLRRLMAQWSSAWAARSRKMFDFYDPEAYTKAMRESFAAFRQNKERLFSALQFIKIYNREIHVLEGPGYWVTWAEQLYTASNLATEGTRRLYWQKDGNNSFRIVGMEWIPRDTGMRADFRKGRLVAETVSQATDASSELPVPPPLTMPERPGEASLPQKEVPDAPKGGRRLEASLLVPPSAPPPPAVILWEKRDPPAAPSPEKEQAGGGGGPSSKAVATQPPTAVMQPAAQDQAAAPPQNPREPAGRTQTPGSPRAEESRIAEYLDSVSADIGATLERWRQSWESGRLDDYVRHYDDKAVQQGRWGAKNIRRQKESLWARIQPTLVRFSGMRIVPDKDAGQAKRRNGGRGGRCVIVDMNQIYADSSGHSDKGTKTLQLCPNGGEWKIHRESWVALPPDPQAEREAALPSD